MWYPPNPTQFNQLVWLITRQIPSGKVSTYGQIASMIPPPDAIPPHDYSRLSPRWVGSALRATPSEAIPWQRVVNSQGKISLPSGAGYEEQRHRLRLEGIHFGPDDRIDFRIYGWEGPSAEWLAEHQLLAPRPLFKP